MITDINQLDCNSLLINFIFGAIDTECKIPSLLTSGLCFFFQVKSIFSFDVPSIISLKGNIRRYQRQMIFNFIYRVFGWAVGMITAIVGLIYKGKIQKRN